ncbi:MAG: AAA family ATPase [Minicystis sp.]
MQVTAGYIIEEVIFQGRGFVVARGRFRDQQALVREVRAGSDRDAIPRLRYGYELCRGLDLPGVARVISLEARGATAGLLMEDFGGRPLATLLTEGRLEIATALDIALKLARTLGDLHKLRITHKGIAPANVLVNARTHEVKIENFDHASRLLQERPALGGSVIAEEALPYVSPEQTGRMNRNIDYRTDFYSLGVLLYQMLAGRLPFHGRDPMALVHGHLAVVPVPLSEARADVPRALSDIVMKLLAKNAEDRYQSAFGLAADLGECLRQLARTGAIDDFPIGKQDAPAAFQVPQKLYGRASETTRLLAAFERVSRGPTELMLVAGHSGVGKSALVNEIHKPVVALRGLYASGKFDQIRSTPYEALIQVGRRLILQMLAESEEKVTAFRERLLEALGASAQVVIDVIPELALVIGPQAPAAELGPAEAQNRWNRVFQRFFGAMAREDQPLVVFIDDLQWADAGSLNMLKLILTDPEIGHMFLIGAYRDNEVGAGHPLLAALTEIKQARGLVDEIALQPISREDVIALTGDALDRRDLEAVAELGEFVHRTTEGNPFFVGQLLTSLYERDLLAFDPALGRWH